MIKSRNKLYVILITACIAGYIWIYYGLNSSNNGSFEGCFIKQLTNIPCPSCGSTRSIILMLKGDFFGAVRINPFGYIIALIMLLSPLWIALDIVTKRKTLFEFYRKIESFLRVPKFAIPLLLLVIFNWIWNITKGL
jgi:hypothetical protein